MKEIFCSVCGHKFAPVGREHICPSCKAEAAAAAKRAAVERAKARSYSGEACPVRISAKARGFIEAVAKRQGTKFIPALDNVLRIVAKDYGFTGWAEVPEHRTARRGAKAAETTMVEPVAPVKASTPSKTKTATSKNKTSRAKTTAKSSKE